MSGVGGCVGGGLTCAARERTSGVGGRVGLGWVGLLSTLLGVSVTLMIAWDDEEGGEQGGRRS